MKELYTRNLQLSYNEEKIVERLNLKIPSEKITALVGRNGSGKSTILKAIARLLKPTEGHVFLNNEEIESLPTKEVAKQLAILPQSPTVPEGLTVEDLVWYGRYPHQGALGGRTKEDERMVKWALEVTGTLELAKRSLTALSGGQRQRVWIAMALAQGTEYLLLDEPTTYLDMAHQLEVLELLKKLNREEKRTIIMVVHDLNHAARYADNLVAIYKGQILTEGSPKDVLNEQMLKKVFGVKGHIVKDPDTKAPLCIPYELVSEEDMKIEFLRGQAAV